MSQENPLNPSYPITKEGIMTDEFLDFVLKIVRGFVLSGSGSPEGVVEAAQFSLYVNESGTAGSILYVKRDTDIAGDKTMGWILV